MKLSGAGRNTNKKQNVLPHRAPSPASLSPSDVLIIRGDVRPRKHAWLEVCHGKIGSLSLLSTSLLLPSLPFHYKTGGVFSRKNEIRKAANLEHQEEQRMNEAWRWTVKPLACVLLSSLTPAAEYISPIFKESREFFSREMTSRFRNSWVIMSHSWITIQ